MKFQIKLAYSLLLCFPISEAKMDLTMIPSSLRLPLIFIICQRLSKNAPEAAKMTYPCSGEIVMVIFISEFIFRVHSDNWWIKLSSAWITSALLSSFQIIPFRSKGTFRVSCTYQVVGTYLICWGKIWSRDRLPDSFFRYTSVRQYDEISTLALCNDFTFDCGCDWQLATTRSVDGRNFVVPSYAGVKKEI